MRYLRVISFFLLFFLSVLISLPLFVVLFVFLTTVFKRFWEGLLAGLFLDSFYFSPAFFDSYGLGFFTIGFLVCFGIIEWVKYILQAENIFSKTVIFLAGLASFGLFFLIFS